MSTEFKLPELGENVENGDVVNVLVSEGDQIEPNQPICELETDKAVIEIPCTEGGRVSKVHFKKGDTIKVGQTLLTLESADEPAAEEAPKSAESEAEPEPSDAPPAPAKQPEEAPKPESEPTPQPTAPATAEAPTPAEPVPAGPAARRLARQLGVDLARLAGSGNRGRVTPEDVRSAAAGQGGLGGQPAATLSFEPVVPPGEPSSDSWGAVRRDKMSKIRRTIAAQMVRSAGTIPHVTNFDDADVTDLENLRKGVPKGYLGQNVKLTMMPFLMKAVAVALRRHPALNASLDDDNEQVVYKEYVHLGVAVDTPRGLVVPKLRDIDRLDIPQIARALQNVAERAQAVDFSIDDLRGGTFTISNLGAVGGTYSTPIINHPEVAILLVGRSRWLPSIREGKVEPRMMMPLSLSYDHRLVDGATAGRFLNEVIDLLENPGKLLLIG